LTDKTDLLRALIEGPTDASREGEALALLRGATTAELNDMIVGTDMHRCSPAWTIACSDPTTGPPSSICWHASASPS